MNPFKKTFSALILGGVVAMSSVANAQDEAAAEAAAPPPPDPREVAAENLQQLLDSPAELIEIEGNIIEKRGFSWLEVRK